MNTEEKPITTDQHCLKLFVEMESIQRNNITWLIEWDDGALALNLM